MVGSGALITVWLAAIRGPGTSGWAMQIFLMVKLMGYLPKGIFNTVLVAKISTAAS